MNKKPIKDWTILIYADGNNDLAPEMWQSKIDAEKVGSSNNVNVVMQIGRESIELINIIRPSYSIMRHSEAWTGVRRYYILKSKSTMLNDLGNICMADPLNLYDFIKWGIETYPSEHYMLILSGHGGGFVAVMSDLSQDRPYMMGIYEMCKAINMIIKDVKIQIDILVFDMCDMNYIEIMYELGKNKANTVKTVLTYFENGPISGLPYDKLIDFINGNSNENNARLLLKNLVAFLSFNLVAIEINNMKLTEIKKLISAMAYLYLTDENCERGGGLDLIKKMDGNTSWYKYILELQDEIESIVICYKKSFIKKDNITNVLDLTTREMCNNDALNKYLPLYYKLAFAKNNYWFSLLSNRPLNSTLSYSIETEILKPLVIPRSGLMLIISAVNPSLNEEEIELILNQLIIYKKWMFSLDKI